MKAAAISPFVFAVVVCLPPTYGQTAPAADSNRPRNVMFSGSLRSRLYAWDWFEPASGDNRYAYSGSILRAGFAQSHDALNWNAEFELQLLGLPSNAIG